MTGIIVAGHGNFAFEIVSIAENILGKQKYLEYVSLKSGEGEYTLNKKLNELINNMEIDNILVLSDIFGGSISNMCIYMAEKRDHIAVITGVNLPMLLKSLTYRDKVSLEELVSLACSGGKDGIVDACGLLKRKDQKVKV